MSPSPKSFTDHSTLLFIVAFPFYQLIFIAVQLLYNVLIEISFFLRPNKSGMDVPIAEIWKEPRSPLRGECISYIV